jgi:hypothetical protein
MLYVSWLHHSISITTKVHFNVEQEFTYPTLPGMYTWQPCHYHLFLLASSKQLYPWSHIEHPLCCLVNPQSSFRPSSGIFSFHSLSLAHYTTYYLGTRTFAYSSTLKISASKRDYSWHDGNHRCGTPWARCSDVVARGRAFGPWTSSSSRKREGK